MYENKQYLWNRREVNKKENKNNNRIPAKHCWPGMQGPPVEQYDVAHCGWDDTAPMGQ